MCQALGDLDQAARHHELCRGLASERALPELEQQALQHAAECYGRMAEQAEAAGRQEEALEQLGRCLAAAEAGGDGARAGQVQQLIGLLLQRSGAWAEALGHHQQAAQTLAPLADHGVEAGRALCSAAECQQQLGQLEAAAGALESFLWLSRSKDPEAAAGACCSLGAIYYQQRKWGPAVASFERFYELARGIGSGRMVDVARVNLGLARGAVRVARFMELVEGDLPALVQWKSCQHAPVW
jgi:tetratricopeptide (TPR) repeat protein